MAILTRLDKLLVLIPHLDSTLAEFAQVPKLASEQRYRTGHSLANPENMPQPRVYPRVSYLLKQWDRYRAVSCLKASNGLG